MSNPILFINACVRQESRTKRLADALLLKLGQPFDEVRLGSLAFPAVDENFLNERDRLAAAADLGSPVLALAAQFARAERIVIAAPYWDLSFPAALKQYLEQINVVGVTFAYTERGVPVGLCRAKQLFYVTSAGGPDVPQEYGYGYVRALARDYYGIPDVRLIMAQGLDVYGADAEAVLQAAEADIAAMPS